MKDHFLRRRMVGGGQSLLSEILGQLYHAWWEVCRGLSRHRK